MRLTKYGHACVALEKGDGRLVIDPGTLTQPDATAGAQAVLVTHEHPDHFSEATLRAACEADPELVIHTNAAVAAHLGDLGRSVHVVATGDRFRAAGFDIEVLGEWHAVVHADIPRMANVGFLVDGELLAPGDALLVPPVPVRTVLAPVHAPWSRTGDLVDWLRQLAPTQAVAVHDGALNEVGLATVAHLLGESGPGTGCRYVRLAVGEVFDTDDGEAPHAPGLPA